MTLHNRSDYYIWLQTIHQNRANLIAFYIESILVVIHYWIVLMYARCYSIIYTILNESIKQHMLFLIK